MSSKSCGIQASDGGHGERSMGEAGTAPVNLVTKKNDVHQSRRSSGEAG